MHEGLEAPRATEQAEGVRQSAPSEGGESGAGGLSVSEQGGHGSAERKGEPLGVLARAFLRSVLPALLAAARAHRPYSAADRELVHVELCKGQDPDGWWVVVCKMSGRVVYMTPVDPDPLVPAWQLGALVEVPLGQHLPQLQAALPVLAWAASQRHCVEYRIGAVHISLHDHEGTWWVDLWDGHAHAWNGEHHPDDPDAAVGELAALLGEDLPHLRRGASPPATPTPPGRPAQVPLDSRRIGWERAESGYDLMVRHRDEVVVAAQVRREEDGLGHAVWVDGEEACRRVGKGEALAIAEERLGELGADLIAASHTARWQRNDGELEDAETRALRERLRAGEAARVEPPDAA